MKMLIPKLNKKHFDKDLIKCKSQDVFCVCADCNRECLEGKICLFDIDNNQYGRLKVKSTLNKWIKNDLLSWISE